MALWKLSNLAEMLLGISTFMIVFAMEGTSLREWLREHRTGWLRCGCVLGQRPGRKWRTQWGNPTPTCSGVLSKGRVARRRPRCGGARRNLPTQSD